MLLSFRFANHRSFCSEQQLNLMPAYPGDHAQPSGHGGADAVDATRPVPIVGIFGANASGKSNVIDALKFMRFFVTQSDREVEPDSGIARNPFRLTAEEFVSPSRYVVDFMIDGSRYTYGFTIDSTAVLEEWLYYYRRTERYGRSGRKTVAFERTGDEFEWGPEFRDRPDLGEISSFTAESALYLSTLARFKIKSTSKRPPSLPAGELASDTLHNVYLWFRRMQFTVDELYPDISLSTRMRRIAGSGSETEALERIASILRQADTGIDGVELVRGDPEAKRAIADYSSVTTTRDRQAFRQLQLAARDRFVFRHLGAEDGVLLELREESRGTRQMLSLAFDALPILDHGGVLLVDEIDVSLHPVLSAAILALFRSARTNPHNAQVVFTTHDVSLLGSMDGQEVLKRDEIWFTEKDSDGCSSLYSLAEFKPRNQGVNRERQYLNGNYGAIPDISFDQLAAALTVRLEDQ
ncbi:AAA family ATPase [Nocardia mangyaensis]|uniref:AAA family ATPase n=1 Tax=Nocardia mangyaensis TaxID=2213200 RepID=UPI000903D694|nr:ATP-binding protein [Nocardia mangyaensis]